MINYMKNYNKILKAVNRGIKFALSDLEDDEELSSISKQKIGQIVDNNSTRKLLELKQVIKIISFLSVNEHVIFYGLFLSKPFGYKFKVNDLKELNLDVQQKEFLVDYINKHNITEREYIDLDLPSGTKWYIENIGATEENPLGSYFRWGCTEEYEKHEPSYKDNCQHVSSEKYTADLNNSYKIESVLDLEDDAAHNIDPHIRIPSKQQYEELIKYTDMAVILGKLFFISKKNPLNFIWFEDKNVLYLTSSYSNEVKTGSSITNMVLSDKNISIYMIKFFKNEVPEPKFLPFINIGSELPPVRGHIRPVWYE